MTDDFMYALSPLDGRYQSQTTALRDFFSEAALFKYRLQVEVRWLLWLTQHAPQARLTPLAAPFENLLSKLYIAFDQTAAYRIKAIEKTCNHDVKAVEYYLKEKLAEHIELAPYAEWVHFGCTSEDINNLAYALMLKDALAQVIFPTLQNLLLLFNDKAKQYHDVAMLARTHGQPATPTTVGKEFANVYYRLKRHYDSLQLLPVLGKFNGAVGNYNAHRIALPQIDWPQLNEAFVTSLGLNWNPYTTQIEPHDYLADILNKIANIQSVLIDVSRDCWSYISLGYFKQQVKAHEVGSSTMPHKVNPIDFENAEGNLSLSQAIAQFLATRLPISRWQRDLVDSTLMRNLGTVFGYALIGYQSLLKGLHKIEINQAVLQQDLNQHYEVLAEAIQTIMRRHGLPMPYEKLKNLTRGQEVTRESLQRFVQELELPIEIKQQLLALTPATYLGYAAELAKNIS